MNAANWGRRFQDMAADASTQYSHVLARYNELLRRVAAGELAPESVQTEFRDYLQESGTAATRELIELSVGLLAGLLYVEAKYREALLEGLLPPGDPVPPPPSSGGVDLTNWFQTLATYANEQSRRGMARYQQLVERVAAGHVTPQQMQDRGRVYLESQAPHFVGEVLELGMDFVARLQQSSTAMADGMYDRVLGEEPKAPSASETPHIVDLRGRPGDLVTAEIVIENSQVTPADVICHLSGFSSRGGGSAFAASAGVTPERFQLAPGEARDVAITLALDPKFFVPGNDYFALLRISGVGGSESFVQVVAHCGEPQSAERTNGGAERSAVGVRREMGEKSAETNGEATKAGAPAKRAKRKVRKKSAKKKPRAASVGKKAKAKSKKTKANNKSAKKRAKTRGSKNTTRAKKKKT